MLRAKSFALHRSE